MLLTGFCRDNFSGGFLVELIFGVDGRADWSTQTPVLSREWAA